MAVIACSFDVNSKVYPKLFASIAAIDGASDRHARLCLLASLGLLMESRSSPDSIEATVGPSGRQVAQTPSHRTPPLDSSAIPTLYEEVDISRAPTPTGSLFNSADAVRRQNAAEHSDILPAHADDTGVAEMRSSPIPPSIQKSNVRARRLAKLGLFGAMPPSV